MTSLNAEAAGELATDLAAAEWLRRLYPDVLPHPLDVHDRLATRRSRLTPRERAFFEGYYETAKRGLVERQEREHAEMTAWRERVFGGSVELRDNERGAP